METKERIDFAVVKATVPMIAALARYGVQLRGAGKQLRGDCPLPSHPKEGTNVKGTFSVNTDQNIWTCFHGQCKAAREGKKGGDVINFAAAMEGCNSREAALILARDAGVGEPSDVLGKREVKKPEPQQTVVPDNTPKQNAPLGWAYKPENLDYEHPYVLGRISKETAREFGIAAYRGPGKYAKNRIVIPIHDEHGALLAYAGRAVNGEEPRYKLPTGFHKGHVLYNLHRVDDAATSICVVEGFFDCLRVHEAGFPNVVALMGCSASPKQQELLLGFDRIILFLDGDEPGKAASAEIALKLDQTAFVRRVIVEGRQPDQMTADEIKKALTG